MVRGHRLAPRPGAAEQHGRARCGDAGEPGNIAVENGPFIDVFPIKTSIAIRDFP